MNEQTVYILPPGGESQEAEVITVKDEKIYYKIFDTKELGEIEVFAQGYEVGNIETQLPSWTANSLVADLWDAYIEKGFNH